ncbi:OsmC family protein [Formosa haliotis]|uniref:OsmC family protein n=1 Tax=Formosa haliotis TaxID=1555194 RepID=UPI0008265CB8|nr:OsmC family protein [Formosa haliotis]
MSSTFQFKIYNQWNSESAQDEKKAGGSLKTHQVFLEDGKHMEVSAAKPFKGDASKYNPEELLMAALSSCHFMSYKYVCDKAGILIKGYKDEVEGVLVLNADGSGAFTKITLKPTVILHDISQRDLAITLHDEASKLCFIANSCAFPIVYKPAIS